MRKCYLIYRQLWPNIFVSFYFSALGMGLS